MLCFNLTNNHKRVKFILFSTSYDVEGNLTILFSWRQKIIFGQFKKLLSNVNPDERLNFLQLSHYFL